jgi:hypothetical protein
MLALRKSAPYSFPFLSVLALKENKKSRGPEVRIRPGGSFRSDRMMSAW